ncbi:histidinol dehydrogenase [Algibacillus agarilyticus]|uniref:histidinol dehydrogenase n=1 Tax=Algibacillus agarilyticus TaxID=2234133 RepID=UPI000DD041AA|nr:histidinol dehydrogenase [Algibacillus agarilyticus]
MSNVFGQTQNWANLSEAEQTALLARPALADSSSLATIVRDIIARVRAEGDSVLIELAEKFDGVKLDNLRVSQHDIDNAINEISTEVKDAIELAHRQVHAFHAAQIPQPIKVETIPGVVCELRSQAINEVGLYVPGGTAPLPSTVIMTATPAKIAGCKRVAMFTPPNAEGKVTPEIRYAAKVCGVDELYISGGAQAIAALAYGTNSIKKVDKIYGPGNSFVTEAKQQVSQDALGAAIDMPAGPSEVLVLADALADADYVAADLLSQAEHGADSQVILITNSAQQATAVELATQQQLNLLPRKAIATEALKHSRIIIVESIEQGISVSNQYAPEHLIVQTENARDLLPQFENAGSIFIGAFTPESAGDYASGTNHVLPTYGYTRAYSSLNLSSYMKQFTVQELTESGLNAIGPAIMALANAEGLDAHKNAVKIRLDKQAVLGGEK